MNTIFQRTVTANRDYFSPHIQSYPLNSLYHKVGPDRAVGIANRYWLDGPGIESRCRRILSHPSRRALVPTQPRLQLVTDLFPGSKSAGALR